MRLQPHSSCTLVKQLIPLADRNLGWNNWNEWEIESELGESESEIRRQSELKNQKKSETRYQKTHTQRQRHTHSQTVNVICSKNVTGSCNYEQSIFRLSFFHCPPVHSFLRRSQSKLLFCYCRMPVCNYKYIQKQSRKKWPRMKNRSDIRTESSTSRLEYSLTETCLVGHKNCLLVICRC